ncbi:hypothetical protein N0614_09530 [Pseudomonas aeruginosa]|nr:hypothetical protein [Pseudomonas aeruginosa]
MRKRVLAEQLSRFLDSEFSDKSIANYKDFYKADIEFSRNPVEKDFSKYLKSMLITSLVSEIHSLITIGFVEKAIAFHSYKTGIEGEDDLNRAKIQFLGYLDCPFEHKTRNEFIQEITLKNYLTSFLTEVVNERSGKEAKIQEIYAEALLLNESFKASLVTNESKIDEHYRNLSNAKNGIAAFLKTKSQA